MQVSECQFNNLNNIYITNILYIFLFTSKLFYDAENSAGTEIEGWHYTPFLPPPSITTNEI